MRKTTTKKATKKNHALLKDISRVTALQVQPGDVLVLEVPHLVSQATAVRMAELLQQVLGMHVRSLVLDGGIVLQCVLRPQSESTRVIPARQPMMVD